MLSREKSLLFSKNPGYPLYMVNVPQQMLYIQTFPADKFFLQFGYLFIHMTKLDFTFVRLYALHMN